MRAVYSLVILMLLTIGVHASNHEYIHSNGRDMREWTCQISSIVLPDKRITYIFWSDVYPDVEIVPCTREFVQEFCSGIGRASIREQWCNDYMMGLYAILIDRDSGGSNQSAGRDTGEPPSIVSAELPREPDVAAIQRMLNERGYDAGPVDGIAGSRTRDAIARFERDSNRPVTGRPSSEIQAALEGGGNSQPGQAGTAQSRSPESPNGGTVHTSDMSGNCQADMQRLEADMARISAQAQGGGLSICETHRANYEVLTKAAGVLRQCPELDGPGNPQAAEFERAAAVSRSALDGPCS